MNVIIRRATLKDLDILIDWRMEVLHEVFSVSQNQSLKALEEANRIYYQNALLNEEHIACFAYQEENIIACGGICLYKEMPSPDNPSGTCAYLMNIYTRSRFRGQGVGKQVVSWLVQEAVQRKVTKIYLETSEAGRALYHELGFQPMIDYMKL
ncbi:GNAT family N-acetyltransferase (plasmid) [Clostridium estertheticum]|nr:GNAT family N-acetyltransferase [Clostridium estertheticum]WAG58446.1 GNAT family N-acetyltransferase [Clostridium estertheticum]